jgi:hypothetical protein
VERRGGQQEVANIWRCERSMVLASASNSARSLAAAWRVEFQRKR